MDATTRYQMRLLAEREPHQIDKAWIEGIRKAWKQWTSEADRYPGRIVELPAATSVDWANLGPEALELHAVLARAADAALAYIARGKTFLRTLREDLLFNKGFWTTEKESLKAKVVVELDAADEAISDARSRIDYWKRETHPHGGDRYNDAFASADSFNRMLRTIAGAAKEYGADAADKAISGRMLRYLSSLLGRIGKGGEGVIDVGGFEPEVVHIGKVTVRFLDAPAAHQILSPIKYGVGAKLDTGEARHLSSRGEYIDNLKTAQSMLEREKLGFLWYGDIEVRPQTSAPENHLGAHFGVGAVYFRQGDRIVIYSNPSRALPGLIVHELGHRYYYKFLTPAGRAQFDKWFGQVKATSTYGGTVTEEDFAEVFQAYVRHKDLSRDQIDRFKTVLNPKAHKVEMREQRVLAGVEPGPRREEWMLCPVPPADGR